MKITIWKLEQKKKNNFEFYLSAGLHFIDQNDNTAATHF